jgi:hypothetical protein
MPDRKCAMISSTARDLPEHRKEVMDACMRLSMFYPEMMEHLSATDANAMEVSLRAYPNNSRAGSHARDRRRVLKDASRGAASAGYSDRL